MKEMSAVEPINKTKVYSLLQQSAFAFKIYKPIRVYFLEEYSSSLSNVAYYDAICPIYREQQLMKITQLKDKLILSQQ